RGLYSVMLIATPDLMLPGLATEGRIWLLQSMCLAFCWIAHTWAVPSKWTYAGVESVVNTFNYNQSYERLKCEEESRRNCHWRGFVPTNNSAAYTCSGKPRSVKGGVLSNSSDWKVER